MTAKDFFKEHFSDDWQPKDKFDEQQKQFDYHDLIDFAEQYHQSKLKQIHQAKVLTNADVEQNRSSAYEYIDFENPKKKETIKL